MDDILSKSQLHKNMRKTDKLAFLLRNIMLYYEIPQHDYVIIAGYGLREIREVTDVDVGVSSSAYIKLGNRIS